MSKNNLELARNGDLIWLNHWDSDHGDDTVFELHADGTASRVGNEEDAPVENLVLALRELARRIRE